MTEAEWAKLSAAANELGEHILWTMDPKSLKKHVEVNDDIWNAVVLVAFARLVATFIVVAEDEGLVNAEAVFTQTLDTGLKGLRAAQKPGALQ